jgi:hypothetical protein
VGDRRPRRAHIEFTGFFKRLEAISEGTEMRRFGEGRMWHRFKIIQVRFKRWVIGKEAKRM